MKEIKINFVDFWPGFEITNNYFYNLLIQKYHVIIDETPDILFYSCYDNNYLKYNCTRIFYTAENIRPDFTGCDFAFSFDYNDRKNHYRLPLYSMYVDLLKMKEKLHAIPTRDEAALLWKKKSKFCCMVVSNARAKERLRFFNALSKIKPVDSGGSVLNNVGGRVADKLEFIKEYKFVISFENSAYDGYTTEKILEPIFKDCIPIYWGNKFVGNDFNVKRFIDFNSFESEEELIAKLLEIDQNDDLAIDMLLQPTFNTHKLSHNEERIQVLQILSEIISNPNKPIATQLWSYLHRVKRFYEKYKKRIKAKFQLIFTKTNENDLE
jgi:hypothetical protein